MTFNHYFLPRAELSRIDSPSGRKYKTPVGELESVTTWLSRTSNNSYLDDWKRSIGEERASKITARAGNRGTALHNNVELLLLNEEIPKLSLFDRALFVPFKTHLIEHVNNIKMLEYPLYSKYMRLAGTVDCVAEYDGTLSIIDFKTSRSKKSREDIENYWLQTAIYSIMVEEQYGVKIEELTILIGVEGEKKIQVFVESRKQWIKQLLARLKENPPN